MKYIKHQRSTKTDKSNTHVPNPRLNVPFYQNGRYINFRVYVLTDRKIHSSWFFLNLTLWLTDSVNFLQVLFKKLKFLENIMVSDEVKEKCGLYVV